MKISLYGVEIEVADSQVECVKIISRFEKLANSYVDKAYAKMKRNKIDARNPIGSIYTVGEECLKQACEEVVKILLDNEIYTYSSEDIWDICNGKNTDFFDYILEAWNNNREEDMRYQKKIIEAVGDAMQSRRLEIESRPRMHFSGGGFGVRGAVKGMVTAGVLNTISDAGHAMRSKLMYDDSDIKQWGADKINDLLGTASDNMINNLYISISNMYTIVVTILQEENFEIDPPTQEDSNKAQAILKNVNAGKIPENKVLNAVISAISLDPSEIEIYKWLLLNMGDEDGSLGKCTGMLGVDLYSIKIQLINQYVEKKLYNIEARIKNSIGKSDFVQLSSSIDLALLDEIFPKIDKLSKENMSKLVIRISNDISSQKSTKLSQQSEDIELLTLMLNNEDRINEIVSVYKIIKSQKEEEQLKALREEVVSCKKKYGVTRTIEIEMSLEKRIRESLAEAEKERKEIENKEKEKAEKEREQAEREKLIKTAALLDYEECKQVAPKEKNEYEKESVQNAKKPDEQDILQEGAANISVTKSNLSGETEKTIVPVKSTQTELTAFVKPEKSESIAVDNNFAEEVNIGRKELELIFLQTDFSDIVGIEDSRNKIHEWAKKYSVSTEQLDQAYNQIELQVEADLRLVDGETYETIEEAREADREIILLIKKIKKVKSDDIQAMEQLLEELDSSKIKSKGKYIDFLKKSIKKEKKARRTVKGYVFDTEEQAKQAGQDIHQLDCKLCNIRTLEDIRDAMKESERIMPNHKLNVYVPYIKRVEQVLTEQQSAIEEYSSIDILNREIFAEYFYRLSKILAVSDRLKIASNEFSQFMTTLKSTYQTVNGKWYMTSCEANTEYFKWTKRAYDYKKHILEQLPEKRGFFSKIVRGVNSFLYEDNKADYESFIRYNPNADFEMILEGEAAVKRDYEAYMGANGLLSKENELTKILDKDVKKVEKNLEPTDLYKQTKCMSEDELKKLLAPFLDVDDVDLTGGPDFANVIALRVWEWGSLGIAQSVIEVELGTNRINNNFFRCPLPVVIGPDQGLKGEKIKELYRLLSICPDCKVEVVKIL